MNIFRRPRRPSPPRRPGRVAAPLASALAAALVGGACGSPSPQASSGPSSSAAASSSGGSATATAVNLAKVTLHIGDQAGAGAKALLTASGLIRRLPFRVQWDDFTSGPPMLQAMASDAVDVGDVGNAPPIFAAAGGAPLDVVGAFKNDPHSTALLVPSRSPITSVAQLAGKKIALVQGSSANAHLLTVLNRAHIPVKDVTLDYLQPAEALAAFTSGGVQAWDVWAPYVEEAERTKGARALVTQQGYGTEYSFVVANRGALRDRAKAAAIRAYIKLIGEANTWAATHSAAWAKVWANATGLPLSVMDQAAADNASTLVPLTRSVVASEQSLVRAFSAAGLIPRPYNFSAFVSSAFMADGG